VRSLAETRPDIPANALKPLAWDGLAPLRLGDRLALGADDLQWIVLRARHHRGQLKWQAVAFVRSTRGVLTRVIRETGAELSPDGEAALNALEPTYDAWRARAVGKERDGGARAS
jgi:hypothetical protein